MLQCEDFGFKQNWRLERKLHSRCLWFHKSQILGQFSRASKGEDEARVKEAIEGNKEWFEELFDTMINL